MIVIINQLYNSTDINKVNKKDKKESRVLLESYQTFLIIGTCLVYAMRDFSIDVLCLILVKIYKDTNCMYIFKIFDDLL